VNESEFIQRVDATLSRIEEALEGCDTDFDWDIASGILTIVCPNGSQVIINRQTPTRQIWVAAKSGGYHLDYDAERDQWQQGDIELYQLLNQALSQQTGDTIELSAA
jgi:CyaY protein